MKIRVKHKKEADNRYISGELDEDESGEYIFRYLQPFEKAGSMEVFYDPTRENTIIRNEKGEPIGISGNKYYIGKREGPTLQILKESLDVKLL